jgi:uncharacterized membrane protein YphA (DoxX/SURF4 family)
MGVMAESGKAKDITLRILTALLGAMFVMRGGMKIISPSETAGVFENWGYPGWLGVATGVIELVCGVLLFIPRFVIYAAGALVVVMAVATVTHLKAGETDRLALPIVLLVIAAVVALMRWRETKSKGS